MITYNHEKFIAQAIDSILMQETDFDFELVIGEDCSTDGTREIVVGYHKRYPDKIRLLLNEKNLGMIPNSIQTLQACTGKYIALLEGDDAWTDPHKLCSQVAFLEENKDFIICYGNATVIDVQGNVLITQKVPKYSCRHLTQKEIIECRHIIPTSTVMFRNHPVLRRLPKAINKVVNGDNFLFAMLGQHGTAGYLDFMPSLYRQHPGGIYSSMDEDQRRVNKLNSLRMLHACINKEYRAWVAGTIANIHMKRSDYMRRHGRITELIRNFLTFMLFSARHRRMSDFLRDLRGSLYQLRKVVMSSEGSVFLILVLTLFEIRWTLRLLG